jgi:hypothetical protein
MRNTGKRKAGRHDNIYECTERDFPSKVISRIVKTQSSKVCIAGAKPNFPYYVVSTAS